MVVGHPLKQTITVRIEETGIWVEVPMEGLEVQRTVAAIYRSASETRWIMVAS